MCFLFLRYLYSKCKVVYEILNFKIIPFSVTCKCLLVDVFLVVYVGVFILFIFCIFFKYIFILCFETGI